MIGLYAQIPRTGSTVITALLQQRFDAYMPQSSPLIEIFWNIQALWGNPNFRVELSDPSILYGREKIVRGMLEGFTEAVAPKKLWIDKHWNWAGPLNYSAIKEYYPDLKMFRTVRDWGEIEESFNRVGYDYSKQKLRDIQNVHDSLDDSDSNILTINFSETQTNLTGVMRDLEQFLGLSEFNYDLNSLHLDTAILDDITSAKLHKSRRAA